MSHFTVLTAITLPEGVEDLLSQSSMQMSVCELVQATRSADIVNRIKTDTVKAETLRNQLQFENFIETLAGYRLEPYWENTEDPRLNSDKVLFSFARGKERCDRNGHAVFLCPGVDFATTGSEITGISTSSTKLK